MHGTKIQIYKYITIYYYNPWRCGIMHKGTKQKLFEK